MSERAGNTRFITEREVEDWARMGLRLIGLNGDVTLTPLAGEAAARLGVTIMPCGDPPAMVGTRTVRHSLLAGDRLVGTFIQVPHPVVAEFVGRLGFHLLCLDAEHSAMPSDAVESLIRAADGTGTSALVRVAGNDATAVAAALDAGAAGVIVPRVNSGREALAAVRAARYPPDGDRGLGPGRAAGYGRDIQSCRTRANDSILVSVQVETRAAVELLDEIVITPGLDLAFIGPNDLATSMGQEPGSTGIDQVVRDVLARCRRAGLLTGIFAADAEIGARWLAEGVNLVLVSSDLGWLAQGAAGALVKLGQA